MRLTADLRMYRHSGIGRYLRNLVPLLLPKLLVDHVRVIGSAELFENQDWQADPRIELFETRAPIYSAAEQMLRFRGAYRDTDLLWVPHYNGPLHYAGRMVATIHDIAPIALPEILDSGIKRFYADLLIRRTVKQAAALLCVSKFTQQEIEGRLQNDSDHLFVTPLGLDADWPSSATKHRENDGAPYLLFVGNVKPNKNLSLLLKAFEGVKDRIPQRLVVVGKVSGFSTDDASVDINVMNGQRVRFAGEVSDARLQALYAGADALVVPSLYEGFGLTLLEAMQLGCPVFSSTAGSLPEVAGNAALYFDPRSTDDLERCLLQVQSHSEMERLSELGRQRVAHYSFRKCAEATAEVMNALLRPKPKLH